MKGEGPAGSKANGQGKALFGAAFASWLMRSCTPGVLSHDRETRRGRTATEKRRAKAPTRTDDRNLTLAAADTDLEAYRGSIPQSRTGSRVSCAHHQSRKL